MINKHHTPLLAAYESRDMLIPWSGGCDSTLLVVEAVRANHRVRTIGFNSTQVSSSSRQQAARKILHTKLQGRFGIWGHDEIDIETSKTANFSKGSLGNPQALWWTMLSVMYVRASDLVSIAWIENDTVWGQITEIQKVFQTGVKILDFPNVSLYLPYQFCSKVEILQRLRVLKISTKDMWWCQEDKIKQSAICVCASCTVYRQALTEVKFLEKHKRP